jgi:putative DNA primase/helicase
MSKAKTGTGPDDRGMTGPEMMRRTKALADEERRRERAGKVLEGPPMRRPLDPTIEERIQQKRDVSEELQYNMSKGVPTTPKSVAWNLAHILTRDPWYRSRLCLNSLSEQVEWEAAPVRDEVMTDIQVKIYDDYGVEFSFAAIDRGVKAAGLKLKYHPVREYLNSLEWDGVQRIDHFLSRYLGVEDTALHRAISMRWLVSCVARGMSGGEKPVKVDTVLILVGKQGKRKSTCFRYLVGDRWFSDTKFDLRNKDSLMSIRGKWIYEIAELDSTRQREQTTVKAFLSAVTDNFRPPYARNNIDSHRQVVFVGTTNEQSFLVDQTGDRRYWPVQIGDGEIRLDDIRRDRDQIWAEAVRAYRGGVEWWLSPEEDAELVSAQEIFRHEDPWQVTIEGWLSDPVNVAKANRGLRLGQLLTEAIGMDAEKQGKQHEMRIGGLLQGLGWGKRRVVVAGNRHTRWFPPSP